MGYRSRLTKDLDRWIGKGWVDAGHRDAILTDAGERSRFWTATGALAILGAVLVAMSALTFVAANWDAMPRMVRFGTIVLALWLAMAGAGRALDRNAPALGHALAILGVALFGAAILLTAQTFNMTSFRNTAVLIWAAAGLASALAIPSRPVLILATLLGALWAGLEVFNPFFTGIVWAYLPLWLATAVLAVRLSSRVSLNLLALGLVCWVGHLLHRYDALAAIADIGLHAAATLIFGAIALTGAVARDRGVTGGGIMAAWFAVVTASLALALQFHLDGDAASQTAPLGRAYAVLALPAAGVVALIAALRMAARRTSLPATAGLLAAGAIVFLLPYIAPADGESMALRLALGLVIYAGAVALIVIGSDSNRRATGTVGIAAFVGQTLYVYAETFGGLLDTALFFLVGGLILFAMSYALLKWRQRPAAVASEGDPA
jgi:uncharacterized membrane protein